MNQNETGDLVSHQELFDSAIGDQASETVAETPQTETVAPPASRDEKGRFASKEPEPEQAQEQPNADPSAPEPALVPSHRLREATEAKRVLEQRASDLERALREQQAQFSAMLQQIAPKQPQPEPEKVDIWENPDAWGQRQIAPVQDEVLQTREFYSRQFAELKHGQETVQKAYAALQAEIASGKMPANEVITRLRRSMDPFGDIVVWHNQTSMAREIGNDPAAYREKVRQELLAELQGNQQQPQTQQPAAKAGTVVSLPPSLTRATASAGPSNEGAGGMTNSELAAYAFEPSRRR